MALTVAEIVHAPELQLELLAEGDLGRPVRWVHATDQADPSPYLRGGEVVLTDGLWLGGGTSPVDYARRLADADVAAVGFGLVPEGQPVPRALIDACRRRRVTLFAVPIEVPFLAISELFVQRVIAEREEPLRRLLRHSDRLLEAVSAPDGATRVLDVLGAELRRKVALGTGEDNRWLRFRVPGRHGGAVLGVERGPGPLDVQEQAAVQQALTALSIDAAHREALRQMHRRFAAELFELARDAEAHGPAISERLRGLGLEPDAGLVAIACDVPDAEARLDELERALAAAAVRYVATARAGRLVAIAEWDPQAPTEPLASNLSRELDLDAAVGVGAAVADCRLLDLSIDEAHRACRLARTRQDGRRSATARELASHTGLLARQDGEVLERFCRELLGPIEEQDSARGSELLATLEAFVFSGGRWTATARRLHVHVNTLRHRLARIEELTGRRIDDPDDRVDFHLALRARAGLA